jgi:hypothetical protein
MVQHRGAYVCGVSVNLSGKPAISAKQILI